MADIDDELLALAGGDSEDEGSIDARRDASSSPPSKRRDAKKTSANKSRGRSRREGSEEDGEASSAPSSPNSLESAPMDESDSDAEPSRPRPSAAAAGDDDEKYPVDGMYMSRAEKQEIMSMPELEREQIIADRISEIERQRQNRLLRQMVSNVENEERKHPKKKRSADTAELEDGDRRSSRARTGKGGTAMDALRKAKEDKARRKEDQSRRRDAYSPGGIRSPAESDDDFDRHSRSPEPEVVKDLPPAEVKDYDRVRLGRNEFAQVCFTPGFENKITGCFIRIAVGPHPDTGVEQYRMAAIKGFTTGRPYALSGPQGSFVTDQYVRAAHGKAIKEFPFIAASSGNFTESELNRYTVTCNNEGVTIPTKQALMDKIDDINSLINYSWTREEIKARLARRNELKRRFDPAERERVSRQLEEARERGDDQRVEELQEELDKFGSQRLAFKTSLGPSKSSEAPKGETEQDRLAERNRENRRLNAEAVRKAQLKEQAKTREMEKAIKRGEYIDEDHSRRLRTKAKFVHDVNEQLGEKKPSANNSGASTPANGAASKPGGPPTKAALLPHLAKLQEEKYSSNKGVPTIHKPIMDDDVIGSLDLDIDVEI